MHAVSIDLKSTSLKRSNLDFCLLSEDSEESEVSVGSNGIKNPREAEEWKPETEEGRKKVLKIRGEDLINKPW